MRLIKKLKAIKNELLGLSRENYYANIFNSTIMDSPWLKDRSFSPGRWAVGYPFLYVLYRILNEIKPVSILELGLGQSTKMTAQYAAFHHTQIQHRVVEHDPSWISFFGNILPRPHYSELVQLPLAVTDFCGQQVTRYGEFQKLADRSYDLLLVDAPFGSTGYSRVDIFDLIPDQLAKEFIIIFDDCNRAGENATVDLLINRLTQSGIQVVTGSYLGEKLVRVIASPGYKFVVSM